MSPLLKYNKLVYVKTKPQSKKYPYFQYWKDYNGDFKKPLYIARRTDTKEIVYDVFEVNVQQNTNKFVKGTPKKYYYTICKGNRGFAKDKEIIGYDSISEYDENFLFKNAEENKKLIEDYIKKYPTPSPTPTPNVEPKKTPIPVKSGTTPKPTPNVEPKKTPPPTPKPTPHNTPGPTPVIVKVPSSLVEYKYPDSPFVPTKEEPIALGAPPPTPKPTPKPTPHNTPNVVPHNTPGPTPVVVKVPNELIPVIPNMEPKPKVENKDTYLLAPRAMKPTIYDRIIERYKKPIIHRNQTKPNISYPWDKPLTDKDPVIPLPQPGPAPIVPKSFEWIEKKKPLYKNQTQPMSYPWDKPLTDKDLISYPEPLPVPLKRVYPYHTPIYKNQTQPMSYPWDKPIIDKDPVIYPQPTPVPLKRTYDIVEYKYPDSPFVPKKEEPVPLGPPPPKVERSVVEYKFPDTPYVPIKEEPVSLGPPPQNMERKSRPIPVKSGASGESKPTAVVVKIPPVAVNEVVLPTTKYTQIDTMKRKQEPFEPQATHQTAPPGTNYAPVSSQTSGEFSTPPPYVYYYPIIRKKTQT